MTPPWAVDSNDPLFLSTLRAKKEELEKIAASLRDYPGQYATCGERIAWNALNSQINTWLHWFPKILSYKDKECGEQVRFRDTLGWRLIINIDKKQKTVHVLYASRIKDPETTPLQTFVEWKQRQLGP
jgi:hypothetical protein